MKKLLTTLLIITLGTVCIGCAVPKQKIVPVTKINKKKGGN